MEYIAEQPLNQVVTIFEKSDVTNEYNEPTYTKKVLNCAVFQGNRKTIGSTGQEILSTAKVAVKLKVPIRSMLYLGETTDVTPNFDCQEIKNVSAIVDEWQDIVGYWLWL